MIIRGNGKEQKGVDFFCDGRRIVFFARKSLFNGKGRPFTRLGTIIGIIRSCLLPLRWEFASCLI